MSLYRSPREKRSYDELQRFVSENKEKEPIIKKRYQHKITLEDIFNKLSHLEKKVDILIKKDEQVHKQI